MATVALRPVGAASQHYRRFLTSGARDIAIVTGLLVVGAVLAFVALSPAIGLAALVFAAAVLLLDAEYATPTRLAVTSDGVTLGWWHRERSYDASAIVVQHDVRRDRFTITRRGRSARMLARFRADDAPALTAALVAAGVEIAST